MKASNYFIPSLPVHLLSAVIPTQKKEERATVAKETKEAQYIWPMITTADHRKMLNNYRSYVQAVNDAVPHHNLEIKSYNNKVKNNILDNPRTPELKRLIKTFHDNSDAYLDSEYNQAVEEFNGLNGMYLNKRTVKPIRPVSLQVFEAFIHAYSVQLQSYVSIWRKDKRKTVPTRLPKVEIHPYQIMMQERGKGVQNLDLSTRTIRRHRDRLEDTGILTSKEFRGTSRPVRFVINPAILSVSEGFSQENLNAENQALTSRQRTNRQHVKVSTRTNRNKKEIKGIVNNSSKRNAPSSLSKKIIFYKSTDSQGAEKNLWPSGKKEIPRAKIPNDYKKYGHFVENLDSRYDLAQKLANREFDYYTPIDINVLNQIVSSTISDDDFRDLCVQDFARSAAAINRHNQAGAGSWYIALKDIDEDFGCINFKGHASTKHDVLKKLIQFRYRLRWAVNWFERREWTDRPYANLYFDPYRTLPTDVSWQYTEKVWTKKMQRITKLAADKKRKRAAQAKRKEALSTDRKARQALDNAIYRYLRKEIDYVTLSGLVIRMPEKQQDQFVDRLQKLILRKLAK